MNHLIRNSTAAFSNHKDKKSLSTLIHHHNTIYQPRIYRNENPFYTHALTHPKPMTKLPSQNSPHLINCKNVIHSADILLGKSFKTSIFAIALSLLPTKGAGSGFFPLKIEVPSRALLSSGNKQPRNAFPSRHVTV